jgi:RNA-directed DNA polymerase
MYVHIKKFETLEASYLRAKQQRGAAGSDGVTFGDIEQRGRACFLGELVRELEEGTYRSLPPRRVEIPKGNGKTRTISVAAIRDRVVQGAIRLLLEPIFEADFSDSSMGARPGRRAHDAIDRVRQALRRRQHHVVDVDLAAFFDNIEHQSVLKKLAQRVQDRQVLALVKWFLRSGGKRGLPQGSPLSPLLANLVLTDLDKALERGGGFMTYVRFLDDMVVLTHDSPKGRKWAERALTRIRQEAGAIGVQINEEKTCTVTMTTPDASFAFLGFDFRWKRSVQTGTAYPYTTPRSKKITELQARVRAELSRNRHLAVADVVARINPIVRGWVNYFRIGNSSRAFGKVRHYVEKRVRRFAAKQRKRHGYGWKRWSKEVVYGQWGVYDDYQIRYLAKVAHA